MTLHLHFFGNRLLGWAVPAILAAVCLTAYAENAGEAKEAAAVPLTATNAPPASPIPKSVFVIPTNPAEGRDPFFPDSSLGMVAPQTEKSSNVVSSVSSTELHLQGISGQADNRIAVINNRNIGEGETSWIRTPAGAISVKVIEIKTNSVVIAIGDERRELRLRQSGR